MSLSRLLAPMQERVVRSWFPGAELVADHSWGSTDTVVLHVRDRGRDLVIKAGGPRNHHIDRELRAHQEFTGPLVAGGRAARLLRADRELKVLVTEYLPGDLVEGTDAEWLQETYRQAGEILAELHSQASRLAPEYEADADARALEWLEQPHRIDAETVGRLRAALTAGGRRVTTLVPTHGDWQPRNWLVEDGHVRVIDFGRADWRPAATDLARLAAQQFRGHPELEQAFLAGYGDDPRDPVTWRMILIREAVGTAAYAHRIGDDAFESQGQRMIRDALATATSMPAQP